MRISVVVTRTVLPGPERCRARKYQVPGAGFRTLQNCWPLRPSLLQSNAVIEAGAPCRMYRALLLKNQSVEVSATRSSAVPAGTSTVLAARLGPLRSEATLPRIVVPGLADLRPGATGGGIQIGAALGLNPGQVGEDVGVEGVVHRGAFVIGAAGGHAGQHRLPAERRGRAGRPSRRSRCPS